MTAVSFNSYNFIFHPLHKDHSRKKAISAVITDVVLTVLTGGTFLLVFGVFHLKEKISSSRIKTTQQEKVSKAVSPVLHKYLGNKVLKEKLKDHLGKLEVFAAQNEWQHIAKHTFHPHSGFDWWMLPTDRPSIGQGRKYTVSKANVKKLKKDAQFMKAYRKGVNLIASSWGFDLENGGSLNETSSKKWTGYQVRLGKMLYSLKLFGQKDLFEALVNCIHLKGIEPKLEKWIKDLIQD